jgi:hypothetical protein
MFFREREREREKLHGSSRHILDALSPALALARRVLFDSIVVDVRVQLSP